MKPADAPADDEADDSAVHAGPADAAGDVPQPRSAPASGPRSASVASGARGAAGQVPQPRSVPGPGDAPEVPAAPADPALSDREREILAFERRWWKHAGAKEQAIRDAFDLSATRYYQILNGLLDNPAALAADPVLVGRLRRLRSTRARNRRR